MNESTSPVYLSARDVRRRYGNVSAMWLVRRLVDSQFPKPVYFARQRFWKTEDLARWEAVQASTPPPPPTGLAKKQAVAGARS